MTIEYNIDQIEQAAAQFWNTAKNFRVWALEGDLGAGKTTFVAAICRHLNADRPVSSPTFSLVNEYQFSQGDSIRSIFHSDWYRLQDAEEAINAGMEDMLQHAEAFCIVEWPQRAPELLPPDTLYVRFIPLDENTRRLELQW
jgi:tRNA threonylcarbamoyladenosine biosynthesis protein TsaE